MKYVYILFYFIIPLTCFNQVKGLKMHHFGVEQGLPSSDTYTVIESKSGHLWFGTDAGVARYDGYEFQTFDLSHGISDNSIFILKEDPFQNIWFLPFNGQIGFIQNEEVHLFPYNVELKGLLSSGEWIDDIIFSTDDQIVFQTNKSKSIFFNTITKFFTTKGTQADYHTIDFFKTNGQNHIHLKRADRFERKWILNDFVYNQTHTFHIKSEARFHHICLSEDTVVFNMGDKLAFFAGGNIKLTTVDIPPTLMEIDRKGKAWVATRGNGVFVYASIDAYLNHEKWLYHLLDGVNVSRIFHYGQNEIWLTTEHQGVYYIPNQNIQTITFENRRQNQITSLAAVNNNVFFGNHNGEIYQLDETKTPKLKCKLSGIINDIDYDEKKKKIWVAHQYNGFVKRKKEYIGPNYHACIGKEIKLTENGYWFVDYRGTCFKRSDTLVYDSFETHGSHFFNCLFIGKEQQVLLGGNTGLFKYDPQLKRLITLNKGFGKNGIPKIKDIAQLPSGDILLATVNYGLYIAQKKENYSRFKTIGLKGLILKSMFLDDNNELWVGSNKGLFHLFQLENGTVKILKIGGKQGLNSNDVNDVTVTGNTVFVATSKGFSYFGKNSIHQHNVLPKICITDILVNEKRRALTQGINFTYKENYVEFDFVGFSFRQFGKLNYAFRLKGIDDGWQLTTSRSVRYPFLPSGEYEFQVKTSNEYGDWSKISRLQFRINKPFWKTWWFYSGCFFAFLLFLFTVHFITKKYRREKVRGIHAIEREKRRRIEAELKALRAQMNPHFTFNSLNSIQSFILEFDQDRALEYMGSFSLLLRKVLENSRYNVITLAEEIEMLRLYLELENLRFDQSIQYEFQLDDTIDPDFQEIPSMIIQPFVENAIRHGLSGKKEGPKKLIIAIHKREKEVKIIVEDSGIGRLEAARVAKIKALNHESLGMRITQDRIRFFNGDKYEGRALNIIDLKDENGVASGTRIEISLIT